MFDLIHELAAIHRTVARDDADDLVSVRLSRTYDADADDVWDAITNPERMARWFLPITGDLRVGGTFQLEGNAGGEIRRCDRPAQLQVTFGGPESVVDVHLSEANGKTTLELVHSVPLSMVGSGAGALFVGPGWDGAVLGLAINLRGASVGDPREAANTPAMIEFNRGSITGWTEAIEQSGSATADEIAGARAAAEAQYTTLPV